MKSICRLFIPFFLFLSLQGCATIGIALYYKKADLPQKQIINDIPYTTAANADPVKNQLNLFLPEGKNFPTLIFVHGGGWTEGDKDLKVGGADVYNNIGRYFASKGIATAVISYGLLPHVNWRTQLHDVASATAWVYKNFSLYHGNPDSLFITGHSAGAQLITRVALDKDLLNTFGLSPKILRGVIPISGVGYNFLDQDMYELGKKKGAIQDSFQQEDISRVLRKKLSPLFFVNSSAPPFLILFASKDPKPIKEEAKTLFEALNRVGAEGQVYRIPKESHASEVLALSRDKTPAEMMTVFIKTLSIKAP